MENVTIIQNAQVKRNNPYGNLALGFRPMPTILWFYFLQSKIQKLFKLLKFSAIGGVRYIS